jgi:hypothetical protein
VLGAVAGLMVAPISFLDPNMMQTILLYAVRGGGAWLASTVPSARSSAACCSGVTITLLSRYVGFSATAQAADARCS